MLSVESERAVIFRVAVGSNNLSKKAAGFHGQILGKNARKARPVCLMVAGGGSAGQQRATKCEAEEAQVSRRGQ